MNIPSHELRLVIDAVALLDKGFQRGVRGALVGNHPGRGRIHPLADNRYYCILLGGI